jgi:hypothetical protein
MVLPITNVVPLLLLLAQRQQQQRHQHTNGSIINRITPTGTYMRPLF